MPHHSRVSIGQVLGHRQTGTIVTAFLMLARDRLFHSIRPLLFSLLVCDFLRSHRRRRRRRRRCLSCSVLSRPVPFRSGSIIYGTSMSRIAEPSRSPLRPTCHRLVSKAFHSAFFILLLAFTLASLVRSSPACCVAATEGHARQLMIAVVVVVVVVAAAATIDCGFGRCIDIHRTP